MGDVTGRQADAPGSEMQWMRRGQRNARGAGRLTASPVRSPIPPMFVRRSHSDRWSSQTSLPLHFHWSLQRMSVRLARPLQAWTPTQPNRRRRWNHPRETRRGGLQRRKTKRKLRKREWRQREQGRQDELWASQQQQQLRQQVQQPLSPQQRPAQSWQGQTKQQRPSQKLELPSELQPRPLEASEQEQ